MIRLALAFAALLVAAEAPPSRPAPPPGYKLLAAPGHRPSPLDRGDPGFDAAGNACLRDGATLLRIPARGTPESRDFAADATLAIDRDLMTGARWDGGFDKSLMVDAGIVFDAANRAYTLLIPRGSNLKSAALLWSADGCRSWHALRLASVAATMEKPDSFNDHAGPPTIVSYERYGGRAGARLWLDLFAADGGTVRRAAPPVLAATDSLLVANQSGGGNSTFTTKAAIYLAYPTTDASGPGTLAAVRGWDRAAGRWSGPARPLARSTTAKGPDDHDIPVITMGPDSRVRIVTGAHHAVFRMLTASAPNSVTADWSAPKPVGAPDLGPRYAQYSYASLNTARDGTITIVARAESRGGPYELVELRRPPGGTWRDWPGGAPDRTLVRPSRSGYAVWRHRVSRAPDGTLYLSFAYVPNMLTPTEAQAYRVPGKGDRCDGPRCFFAAAPTLAPVTLVSRDAGASWQ